MEDGQAGKSCEIRSVEGEERVDFVRGAWPPRAERHVTHAHDMRK